MNVLESFSLAGKVALVTGGAGLYGRQIVAALAEAGARTYLASRNLESIEEVAKWHREQGHDVFALPLDQGDEDSILALKSELEQREGRLDILVNNAVARTMKAGYEDTAASFTDSMRINATGLFLITRSLGELLISAGGGSIINIGSIQGMIGPEPALYEGTGMSGFYPDYFFHKGGIINFTRFCSSYYGQYGIRCNCISAGGFFNGQHPDFVRRYSEKTTLGRMAGDEDLKGLIVYLASDASLYMTGTNLPLDGGYTAK